MKQYTHVYLLGIGGIGMSALARWFCQENIQVFGYDRASSALTDQLIQEGMSIHFEDDIATIPPAIINNQSTTLVVYSAAIPSHQPLLAYLQANNYQVWKRAAVLGKITQQYYTLAIAGTHGKTTTTALAAHVLYSAGKNITAFLGGIAKNYQSNLIIRGKANQDKIIVIEADEFDRFFLALHPDIAIVTTANPDHLDTYTNQQGVGQGFTAFLDKIPSQGLAILHEQVAKQLLPEPVHQPPMISYALATGQVHAANIHIHQGSFCFDYISDAVTIKDICLSIPGTHNIENALAVITACLFLGIDPAAIRNGMNSFQGVKRRFDLIIEQKDLVFLDDYGHHPVEIAALLKTIRQVYQGRQIAVVFRPNLYTRTRDLAHEFAKSLGLADCVFLLDIYPDRESPIQGVSAALIFDQLDLRHKYLCTQEDLLDCLAAYGKPEVMVNLGSGGTSQLIQPIKEFLLRNWP